MEWADLANSSIEVVQRERQSYCLADMANQSVEQYVANWLASLLVQKKVLERGNEIEEQQNTRLVKEPCCNLVPPLRRKNQTRFLFCDIHPGNLVDWIER